MPCNELERLDAGKEEVASAKRLRERRQRANEELKRSQSDQQGAPAEDETQGQRQLRRQDSNIRQKQGASQQGRGQQVAAAVAAPHHP